MDPKNVISDEESQALAAAAPLAGTAGPAPAGHVQDLHADHWERILADRAPALESVAERMCSLLKMTGRRFFRTATEVTAHPLRSVRWGAYARALPAPTSLNVIDIRPAGLRGLISLDAEFVFTLIDVFFGGDGKSARPLDMIEFTPVEQRLTHKFVETVAADLKQAWKPFLDLDFALVRSETNPIFAAVAASSETVSVARFGFTVGEREIAFDVVLPAAIVEPLRSLSDSGSAEGGPQVTQKWQSRLREDIQEARVLMRALLAGCEVSLRDIAMARPGDIIPIELPANVIIYAEGQPLLEGAFGTFQGRNAVRIAKPVNRRILGESHGRASE